MCRSFLFLSLAVALCACGGSTPADGGAPMDASTPHDAPAADVPVVDAAVDAPPLDAPVCLPNGVNCTVDSDCCSGACFVDECM